ncbi:putative repeat protein (TIGR03943 family) [Pseudonocardia hierapolitana]|uniref:Putative repeat protein (TIGR03943 family) n=1 Tax=Pseudonocardia hierapolitana TaxID=1128676 RepID=A0A561SPE0_9PSEU|nr:TIGR03943 family protein [Pseudonocardia hierapolitana]TWF76730.1 putative repeat protein (TIGR03943 family) [Pseudonocardia hierapolitana]
MRRDTQHVLLVLLGGALLRIAADDTYLRYVRPSHRWLLLAAGAVIVVLAVTGLLRDRAGPPPHEHGGHTPWLLLAPVLVIALVAPPALGADAVGRAGAGNATVQASDVFGPLPPDDPAELPVAEFVQRAVWDSTGSLAGREVVLTGFVVRRGAAVELARLTIACCAADARPNRVRLVGNLDDHATDTWLQVQGVLQEGSATAPTGLVPTLTVTAATVVPAPPDPYEY